MTRRSPAGEGSRNREQVQALARGLAVLAYLNRVGIATNMLVARRFHLKVSTAHRTLMVLTRMGMLRHDLHAHQFMLASKVRSLSAGFRELPLVDEVALPRMQAWTRRHGLRLLLVTEDRGERTVAASTSAPWPLNRELPVAGNSLSESGSGRTVDAERERQISVPVLTRDGFHGCLSLRCSTDIVRSRKAVRHWAAELRSLAADIVAAHDGRPGPADDLP